MKRLMNFCILGGGYRHSLPTQNSYFQRMCHHYHCYLYSHHHLVSLFLTWWSNPSILDVDIHLTLLSWCYRSALGSRNADNHRMIPPSVFPHLYPSNWQREACGCCFGARTLHAPSPRFFDCSPWSFTKSSCVRRVLALPDLSTHLLA